MKRILFIAMALLLAAGAMQAKPVAKQMGVQLYSIRELIGSAELYAKNHVEVFANLKKMGYTAIEAANYSESGQFYGVSPEQFKADVETAGLEVLSSHVGHGLSAEEYKSGNLTKALAWWDKTIAAHKAAGMKFIVMPWAAVPGTLAEMQVFCDYLNAIGKKCVEAGIAFGYHNHSQEFRRVEDKEVMEDYMLSHTDPKYVFFQLDVYWAMMGQASPVAYFKKYPGRFKLLHIKDQFEVGQSGMVGFDAIFNNAKTAGMTGYIVELEGTTSSKGIMDGMRQSADYLLSAPFVKASYK